MNENETHTPDEIRGMIENYEGQIPVDASCAVIGLALLGFACALLVVAFLMK